MSLEALLEELRRRSAFPGTVTAWNHVERRAASLVDRYDAAIPGSRGVAWLLALPFRLIGLCVRATFALLAAILFLPARLLGHRPAH